MVDLEILQSRLKQILDSTLDPSSGSALPDPRQLIQESASNFEAMTGRIKLDDSHVESLGPEDLDAFMEQLLKEIDSADDENARISGEIDDLTKTLAEDSNSLDDALESLAFSLNHFDLEGQNIRSFPGDVSGGIVETCEDSKFEILKLQYQIEKSKNDLGTFQDAELIFKRIEAISQIEDTLSEVKVLEFEANFIRLSLKTPLPSSDGLFSHKLDFPEELSVVEHELLIEVMNDTMELCKVEIFPNDIHLDEIINSIKSSSRSPVPICGSLFESLVRRVQYHILLCNLKRLSIREAKKSRHSFDYSEGDAIITAHLVAGIDAFIKIPRGWPISQSGVMLVSLKNTNPYSESISLNFLCKIKELVNSLNSQTRCQLVRFLDALEEILVRNASELNGPV